MFERKSKWIVYMEHKDLSDIDLKGGDWIDVIRGQGWMMGFCAMYTLMNLPVLYKIWEISWLGEYTVGFSRTTAIHVVAPN
jgi:hypothetical protein